jgi:hypothetical protein
VRPPRIAHYLLRTTSMDLDAAGAAGGVAVSPPPAAPTYDPQAEAHADRTAGIPATLDSDALARRTEAAPPADSVRERLAQLRNDTAALTAAPSPGDGERRGAAARRAGGDAGRDGPLAQPGWPVRAGPWQPRGGHRGGPRG